MSVLPFRTDEQRLAGAPFTVRFGDGERSIRPLPRKKSREWQALLVASVLQFTAVPFSIMAGQISEEIVQKLGEAFMQGAPETLAGLVFWYANAADPEITREWFEENVADEEIAEAFLRMVEVTYPFYLRESSRVAFRKFLQWMSSESGISPKSSSTNGESDGTLSKTGRTSVSG